MTSRLLINNYDKQYNFEDKDIVYFNVRLYSNQSRNISKEKIGYLDFDIQNDFSLVCGKDSISPGICQRIQNGVSTSYEYIIGFNNEYNTINGKDFTLAYSDKIFGIGSVAFVYNQKDILKIPSL
ncbi:MAG: hypothetical protein J7497_14050 [Chitinophagaceae bacterium]|nr:hypothetical protein [Chitinophagaceae bacterium]